MSSAAVRGRVEAAREAQRHRFAGTAPVTNADMGPRELLVHAALDEAGEGLMKAAVKQLHLSARSYHRVLKLARTIANLARQEQLDAARDVTAPPPHGPGYAASRLATAAHNSCRAPPSGVHVISAA